MPLGTPLTIIKSTMLAELERLINLTEKLAPKCRKSVLWRRARNKALWKAHWVELGKPWVDDEPEDVNKLFVEYMRSKGREIEDLGFEENEPEYDLDAMLEEVLGRPPRYRK